jgi:hypothetical protein
MLTQRIVNNKGLEAKDTLGVDCHILNYTKIPNKMQANFPQEAYSLHGI